MIELTPAGKEAPTVAEATLEGLAEFTNAALEAAGLMTSLFQNLMFEIIDKSMGEIETDEIETGEAVKMSEFRLPFFFDEDDLAGMRKTHSS